MASEMNNEAEGRLPLLAPSELDTAQSALHDRMMSDEIPWARKSNFTAATEDGRLLGPFNFLLYNPQVGTAYLDYFGADRASTSLSKRVHEIVILTVGAAWHADYEIYAHTAVAKSVGLEDDAIAAITNGRRPEGLSADELSAYDLTKQLVVEHRVTPDTYSQVVRAFGERGAVDIVSLTGLYLTTCAVLNAFEVPVPDGD